MMRDDKLIELFDSYTRDEVTKKPHAEHGAPPTQLPPEAYGEYFDLAMGLGSKEEQLRSAALKHAAWMAAQAIGFIKEAQALDASFASENVADMLSRGQFFIALEKSRSKREKAMRWLGFIQGVLWLSGIYTLDELKEHSRRCSDDPEKAETKNG